MLTEFDPEVVDKFLETRLEPWMRPMFCDHVDQLLATGHSTWDRYHEFPVPPDLFISSPEYMNKPDVLYPNVMAEFVELNSGDYVEAVLTGGIGSGKTTMALYTTAYQLYLLSILKEPHKEYGLDPSSEILFIFQNKNERLAKVVEYDRFRSMIEGSPYFQRKFTFDPDVKSKLAFPNRIEVVPVSGMETAAIGQNVMGGIIDELNYMARVTESKKAIEGESYDQAVALYNSIARRRKTRFMEMGKLPGILCLVSSRRYPGQFTDHKEEEAKEDPTIFVYDKCVWQIKPEGSYSGKTFPMFIGDDSRKARILEDDEAVDPRDRDLVRMIPVEFLKDFQYDPINALREVAGVATRAIRPFFHRVDMVAAAFGKSVNILNMMDIDLSREVLKYYKDRFFKPELPRFAHVDASLTGDATGVAIGTVTGFMEVERGEGAVEVMPLIRFDCILRVVAPRDGEIEFEKVRKLFYMLRDAGLNIKWVTYDGFQSRDSLQILRSRGFSTGLISVDKTLEPYDMLKTAIYDGRVSFPTHKTTKQELLSLEYLAEKGKVDHHPQGSKDCSDACASVVYGLTRRTEIWHHFNIPHVRIPPSLFRRASTDVSESPPAPG